MENEISNFELNIVRQEKNVTTNQFTIVIEHPVVDGTGTVETRVPRGLLNVPHKLSEKLVDAGAPIIENFKKECSRLSKLTNIPTITTTDIGGWHGGILISRHGVFTEEGADVGKDFFQFNPDNPLICAAKEKGTLSAYNRGIKQPLAYSRYLQFMMSLAFAAPLGAFIGRVGGSAFNISGKSSRGKTLSLLTNLSVVTEPTETNLLSIASTQTFFTNYQKSFGATCVPFSDMKTIMGRKDALFDVLRLIVFNNHDRSARQTAVSSNVKERGFSIPLFNSEAPLREMFDPKKFDLQGGDIVRLIDIPVPDDTGIFDMIPEDSNLTGAELARNTEKVIKNNYGHLLPYWIYYLVGEGPEAIKEEVEKLEAHFMEMVERSATESGRLLQQEEARIAKSFALVAAAGVLAARNKDLPIKESVVEQSIIALFLRCIKSASSPQDNLVKKIQEFTSFAKNKLKFPLIETGVEVLKSDVPNGFRRKFNGKTYLYIYPDAMMQIHNDDIELKNKIYTNFHEKGALIKKHPQEWTIHVKQKGLGRSRMLKFRLSKI